MIKIIVNISKVDAITTTTSNELNSEPLKSKCSWNDGEILIKERSI